jgi:transposase
MASLTKKVIRGRAYYYLRECQRVGGKPRIVFQRYLGTAEALAQRLAADGTAQPPAAREAEILSFGAEAALYALACRLDLGGCIDRRFPKREHGAPSVGTLLLLAILQRAVAPGSKASLAAWHAQSVLRRLLPAHSSQLSSQRFWDAMNRVQVHDVEALEQEITTQVVRLFDLDLRCLLFDCTNFFCFIDSFNDRPTLPRRGHSKEGRASLRLVGMALLCTADFEVPLFHQLYPGNQADPTTFRSVLGALCSRCQALSPVPCDITLVFDKGNNAQDTLQVLAGMTLHFIGSLSPTQHKDLLDLAPEALTPVQGFPGVRARRLHKTLYGTSRTVLVTFNQELFDAQAKTLRREVQKRIQQLETLQKSLVRRQAVSHTGPRPTLESIRRKVAAMLRGPRLKALLPVTVTQPEGCLPQLTYQQDPQAWATLNRTLLGKTLLFTDREDWTDAQILAGYRSQYHVESDFRRLKDPYHLAFRPAYHWTDQKLRVHAFTCVLALLLCNLLRRQLAAAGLSLSVARLLDTLGGIREVATLCEPVSSTGHPSIAYTLSRLEPTQRRLYNLLNLEAYRAR